MDDGDVVPGDGLTLRFPSAAFPVTTVDARIDEVDIRAMSVRATGDAAPGDDRTTRLDARLRYTASDRPAPIQFEQAPVGLYSSVDVRMASAGDGGAFEIRGTCMRDGQQVKLEIESDQPVSLSIAVDETLAPGGAAEIDVALDAALIVANIDWESVPLDDNGDVTIGDSSPAMAQVLAGLRAAFGADAPQ